MTFAALTDAQVDACKRALEDALAQRILSVHASGDVTAMVAVVLEAGRAVSTGPSGRVKADALAGIYPLAAEDLVDRLLRDIGRSVKRRVAEAVHAGGG